MVQAALMATSKSVNVNPIREGDGKVDEEVCLEVTLISPQGLQGMRTYTRGAKKVPEEWSGLHRCNLSL